MNNVNPMAMMKIAGMIDKFKRNHPKIFPFFRDASTMIREGAILEITVTSPEGESMTSNIRVTADDMELLSTMKELGTGQM